MVTIFKLMLFLFPLTIYSWNATGHALIMALALHKMPQTTQHSLLALNHTALDGIKPQSLLEASVWLDKFYSPKYRFLKKLHYTDIPFGQEKYFPKKQTQFNAIAALHYAHYVLESRYHSALDKTLALRIYLHVIADLHQPMHAISYYSKRFPQGDKGGNRYRIKVFHRHTNLHHFWDEAGGYLRKQSLAHAFLELKDKPCLKSDGIFQPQKWAEHSYYLASHNAYFPPKRQNLMANYQSQTKALAKEQIQRAACRMAATLSHIYIHGLDTVG